MDDTADQQDHLKQVGHEVKQTLQGLSWKIEEACEHLDVTDDPAAAEGGLRYAEGTYKGVAAELEDLARQLRAATTEDKSDPEG